MHKKDINQLSVIQATKSTQVKRKCNLIFWTDNFIYWTGNLSYLDRYLDYWKRNINVWKRHLIFQSGTWFFWQLFDCLHKKLILRLSKLIKSQLLDRKLDCWDIGTGLIGKENINVRKEDWIFWTDIWFFGQKT